jgi:hypothetical protein
MRPEKLTSSNRETGKAGEYQLVRIKEAACCDPWMVLSDLPSRQHAVMLGQSEK